MATDIEKVLNDVQSYSDSVKTAADDAAADLRDIANNTNFRSLSFGDPTALETNKPLPIAGLENAPTLGDVTFDWDSDFFSPDRFTMPQIDSDWFLSLEERLNREIAEGDPNTVAILGRLYGLLEDDDSWLSTDLRASINTAVQALVVKLTSDIEDGGTGISLSVQTALFNSMYERDNQAISDALDFAEGAEGRRGFTVIGDITMAARDNVLARQDDNLKQRSRDIMIRVSDMAQQNVQFASNALIQLAGLDQQTFFGILNGFTTLGEQTNKRFLDLAATGNDMEKAKVDYAIGYARVFHDLSNTLIRKFEAEVGAKVVDFEGQLKVILAGVDVSKINADLEQSDNILQSKQWEVDARMATERTRLWIADLSETSRIKLQAAESLTDFYRSLVSASLSQVNTLVSSSDTE